jgi:hypothetical protein
MNHSIKSVASSSYERSCHFNDRRRIYAARDIGRKIGEGDTGTRRNISYRGHSKIRFCYVVFNSHMFHVPRFNSEKDVCLNFFLL